MQFVCSGHVNFEDALLVLDAHFAHVDGHRNAHIEMEFSDFTYVVADTKFVEVQFSSHLCQNLERIVSGSDLYRIFFGEGQVSSHDDF